LVDRLIIAGVSPQMANFPWKGRGQVTWTILISRVRTNIKMLFARTLQD